MTTLIAVCNANGRQGRCNATCHGAHELRLRLHPRWPQPRRDKPAPGPTATAPPRPDECHD